MPGDRIEGFNDKYLDCVECACPFLWTASEQRFFHAKQLQTPRRCPSCREARKRTINPSGPQEAPRGGGR